MPWKETCAMDQRVQFISDYLSGDFSKRELCEAYGMITSGAGRYNPLDLWYYTSTM